MRVYVSLGARRGRQMPREMPPIARVTKTRSYLQLTTLVESDHGIREVHPKEHRRVAVTSAAYHSIPAVRVFLRFGSIGSATVNSEKPSRKNTTTTTSTPLLAPLLLKR